jgi:hypothetical protein
MSHEHLTPTRPALAIQTYLSALPLIQTLISDFPSSGNSGPDSNPAFTRYREFWRWTERLLWRCIILLSKQLTSSSNGNEDDLIPLPVQKEQLSSLLSLYRSFSFPPTFRPAHRSTIYKLHLRLLVLRSRSLPPLPPSRAPEWMNEARAVVAEYRTVLGVKTHFPRAEERNRPVLEFVDLVVAVWEAAGARGEGAGWAIDVSSRLFRSGRGTDVDDGIGAVVGHPAYVQCTVSAPASSTASLGRGRPLARKAFLAALHTNCIESTRGSEGRWRRARRTRRCGLG